MSDKVDVTLTSDHYVWCWVHSSVRHGDWEHCQGDRLLGERSGRLECVFVDAILVMADGVRVPAKAFGPLAPGEQAMQAPG